MKKNTIKFIGGILIGFALSFSVPAFAKLANTVFKEKVVIKNDLNIHKGIQNTRGPVRVKDQLRVKKLATFLKNINAVGTIKNKTVGKPVKIDDDLRVTGAAVVDGVLDASAVDLVETDITLIDTSALTGGEIRFNGSDDKLYMYNGTSWVDLGLQGDASAVDLVETDITLIDTSTLTGGEIRFNAADNALYVYDGTSWVKLGLQGDVITELSTITSGTWQGSPITDAYIGDDITASNYLPLVGGTMTGDSTIAKTNPSMIFDGTGITDFWMGIPTEELFGPYEGIFQIGTGTTPGTSSSLSVSGTGVGIGVDLPLATLHIDGGDNWGVISLDGTPAGCFQIQDTDGGGFTSCTTLNGVLSCSASPC